MKYTIFGFNQKSAVEMGLSNDDLLLLRWFVDFKECGKMDRKYIKDTNNMGYWVSYSKVIADLPILFRGKTDRANKVKLQRMLDGALSKILLKDVQRIKNQNGTKVFISIIPEQYSKLIEAPQESIDSNKEDITAQDCVVSTAQDCAVPLYKNVQSDTSIKDTSIKDTSIKNRKEKIKEKEVKPDLPFSALEEQNTENNSVILPEECNAMMNKQCLQRLKAERELYGINFNVPEFYNILLDSIQIALERDGEDMIKRGVYPYFINTLKKRVDQYNLAVKKEKAHNEKYEKLERRLLGWE